MNKFYKLILLVLILSLSSNVSSQYFLYYFNGKFKYVYGNSEPDANWRNINFDDSGWLNGYKTIGYGDGDDTTIINKTGSIYLRIKFDVADKSKIKDLNFLVDYDDAFVAYLNGTEIARKNLGKPGETISHDRLADCSHEAVRYRQNYNYPFGIYIDSSVVKLTLQTGTNVLSVQVHNDSIDGSDMSFESSLFNYQSEQYRLNYSSHRSRRQVDFDSSNLPIINITTDEYGVIGYKVRGIGKMGIIDNGSGKVNRITDNYTTLIDQIAIKTRGNISQDGSKKNYTIETQDINGNDTSISIFGMPKENDWILYGPYYDKSLVRNELLFMLGRNMGQYEPRTKWCELVINGEYLGIYLFVEKIKRDVGRVNVTKIYPLDIKGVSVTGGYIFKYDKDDDGSITFVYPENPEPEQHKYVGDFFNNLYKLLDSVQFADKTRGYRKYVDDSSLVDYVVLNELLKNSDSYKFSSYMYKDRDDKDGRLKYGPMWDNDLGFGNGVWQFGFETEGWQYAQQSNNYMRFHKYFADTALANMFSARWKSLRKNILSYETIENSIDSLIKYTHDARIRNNRVYGLENKNIWDSWGSGDVNPSYSFEGDVSNLKTWITKRLDWIDKNCDDMFFVPPVGLKNNYVSVFSCRAYPNPFKESFRLTINASNAGEYEIEIYDIYGRKLIKKEVNIADGYNELSLSSSDLQVLRKGIYIVSLLKDGKLLINEKVMKE